MKRFEVSGEEPQTEIGVDEVKEEQVQPQISFPPKHREPLVGLLFLGYLEHQIEFAGHRFTMKTLNEEDYLVSGLIIKEYEGTAGFDMAYKSVIIAQSILDVDGQPLYERLSPSESPSSTARRRFEVVSKWYPQVVNHLYSEYKKLDSVVASILESLGES